MTGSGAFRLPFELDGDVRSFAFDAHAAPYSRPVPGFPEGLPTDAVGRVETFHWFAEDGTAQTARGDVDCLVTGPRTATLTAVIAEGPDEWVGRRLGFSVYDGPGGRDRVGLSWGVGNLLDGGEEAEVGTCMAPAPFAPVVRGGFNVAHAELR
ncbi:hypothetical protein [Streptomyces sp. NBC_01803]|uniref:hypothetical protein n=1 Tax=Streptomyces sp. NBC_01803 TaxID=2975946 RepID=UPI002DD9AE59|nr:hypothetical protein [Streptomyces sp. NBC_01803]WSA44493.1 hypothetical protein OIE51_09920 [Streptomyces sp. NBC_01803]